MPNPIFSRWCFVLLGLSLVATATPSGLPQADGADDNAKAGPWQVVLTAQSEVAAGTDAFHRASRTEKWEPAGTAVIVCDMWDAHHCFRAVQRATEMAPRMNQFLNVARNAGATIIHAPSSCMDYYADHAARKRVAKVPKRDAYPDGIDTWCHQIPAEPAGSYPIDQSDGGEDDTPAEHAAWEAELKRRGLDPQVPWTHQMPILQIDAAEDFISDSGSEIWNILEDRSIDQVILVGVHTNMCVLGRPFGLRRMSAAGKKVVLMRDLTDTMYNPAAAPMVSHFTGTDLIVDYIERYVCPTVTSDQWLGGTPFQFAADRRPRLAMLIGEDEYETQQTLTSFALTPLGKHYRVDMIYADAKHPNFFPGLERIADADALLVSVRRRPLAPAQIQQLRAFVADGKPVIGIRTANHGFSLRQQPAPAGLVDWPGWDAEVFGGNYTNHHGNNLAVTVTPTAAAKTHPIMAGIRAEPFASGGSLYRVAPLAEATTVLLNGSVEGKPAEPIAWTFSRADGGRSFYTSLGHRSDFEDQVLPRMLKQAIDWALLTTPSP